MSTPINSRTALSWLAFGSTLSLLPNLAQAQTGDAKVTQFVPDGDLKNAVAKKPQGWDFSLALSANLAIAQSSNVVGQPVGVSYLMGFGVTGALEYLDGPHEFRMTLQVLESFSKTPALDEVTKANDVLRLEGMYSYFFNEWAGAFGRATFDSSVLPTDDVRATAVDYQITRLNGMIENRLAQRKLTLASPFSPLTLTESIGLIAKPVDTEPALITVRVGGGGRETIASGVFINKDVPGTPQIDIIETDNVIQGGIEAAAGIAGKFKEQRLSYAADFGLLIPLANNDAKKRSATDLMRIGFAAAVNFSMFDWLGLTYQLRLLNDPQLVEGFQVQNNFFLTFKYDVIPPRKVEEAPKADPVADAQAAAAAAEERAKAAEEKAKAAEERAKAAEDKAKATPEPPPPAPAPEPTPAPTPP